MNDNVVARPCWTILANKAEDKIALIQNELAYTRKHLEGLKSSQERVQKMYNEYRDGLTQTDTNSVGMREANISEADNAHADFFHENGDFGN